jgi:hypothetical protein
VPAYRGVATSSPWGVVTVMVPGDLWPEERRAKVTELVVRELEVARAAGMPAEAMRRRLERALADVGGVVVVGPAGVVR